MRRFTDPPAPPRTARRRVDDRPEGPLAGAAPVERQRKALLTLTRIVARQVATPPSRRGWCMNRPEVATASEEISRPDLSGASPGRTSVGLHSGKIHSAHLERWAIVYVRQSSLQQVLEHRELDETASSALADHAVILGWPADRVLVIDEDQGRSGRSGRGRGAGRPPAGGESTMDHVGMVLGLEMSRLARSSKDWHHLIEICALFGTLLAPPDLCGRATPMDADWAIRRGHRSRGKAKKRRVPMAEWKVLIRDRLPAYITWERYLKNQECLDQNRWIRSPEGPFATARHCSAAS